MRKNWISWKRTPLGSAMEVATPFVLMMILVIARQAIKVQVIDSVDLS